MKISPSFRPVKASQPKIDRYSDKYLSHVINSHDRRERLESMQTNLEFFPEELHVVYVPSTDFGSKNKKKSSASVSFKDTISHLDILAQKEESNNDENGKDEKEKEKEDLDDGNENDEIENEEFEDETDYNLSYFDNGEEYGDHDDGNDEAVF